MILSKQKNRLFSLFQALFVRPSPNRRKFFVLGMLVIFLFLFIPRPAHAFPGDSFVIGVLSAIAWVCKMFVSLAAWVLSFMLRSDIYNFANESAILFGWKICRDLCNLIFLLILIFIAFCTILQIPKYHAKNTLLTLIIMALLINFSKPIAIFIFDGSQILMNYFLNATGDYVTNVTNVSGLSDIIYNNLTAAKAKGGIDGMNMVGMQIATIIFLFMFAVALFVMFFYLLIRLIALWILIIVSPFAFLFAAIPDFKKYSDEWWSALFKYCYTGPILAFFLYLSTKLGESAFIEFADANTTDVGLGNIITLGNAIHYTVVLVFLYTSIIMAQKFGIAFAGGITSGANRALKWSGKNLSGYNAAKWGTKKGGKWFDREVLAKGVNFRGKNYSLSPKVWKAGWNKKTKEREEDVYGDAEASFSDRLSERFKAGRKPPDYYKRKREAEQVSKYRKEQETMGTSSDICLEGLKNLKTAKMDPEEKRKRALAYTQTLFANRDYNEHIKHMAGPDGDGKAIDAADAPTEIRSLLEQFGMKKDDQDYHARRFGEMAMSAGDYHLYNLEQENPDERRKNIAGKLGTVDNQQFQIKIHPEAIFQIDKTGILQGLSKNADIFIKHLESTGGAYINRNRGAFSKHILSDKGREMLKEAGHGDFVKFVEQNHVKAGGDKKPKEKGVDKNQRSATYDNEYPDPYR